MNKLFVITKESGRKSLAMSVTERIWMKITHMIFKVADWLLIAYVYVSNALADWKRKRKK